MCLPRIDDSVENKITGSHARAKSRAMRWNPPEEARAVAFYGICMVLIYRLTKAGDAFAGERKNGVPVDGTNDNKISILTNIRPPKNSQNSAERPPFPPPGPALSSPFLLSPASARYIYPAGPMINGSRRLCRLCEKLQSSPILSVYLCARHVDDESANAPVLCVGRI